MLPFLLLAHRAEDAAADDEHASIARIGGLGEGGLHRVRMERESFAGLDLAAYAGVILGGGPYNASDPPQDKSPTQRRVEAELGMLLGQIVDRDVPFLGLCYGIGMLGTRLGGVVDRTFGEPVGRIDVVLTDAGRVDPLFEGLPERFEAFGGHKEGLTVVPVGVTVLATSPVCPVQAFRVGHNVYAVQFHPELDAAGLGTRIDAYRDFGYFPPEHAEALKAAARAREVPHAGRLLRRFVRRYSRPMP
ncbi:MAG: glutamine amidotransferase [Dermatophilaceae bacterium]